MEQFLGGLLDALGGVGLAVLLALLVAFSIAGIIAAYQGREVSLWPPRIGPSAAPKTESNAEDPPNRAGSSIQEQVTQAQIPMDPRRSLAAPPTGGPTFDHEFSVHDSMAFYDAIATNYDLRNSSDLLRTHQAVVTRIKGARSLGDPLRVLDLGGGTGRQIATQFFDEPDIHWTYIDFSAAMVKQFQENLRGTALGKNADVIIEDIHAVHERLDGRTFDVVLMSLVLSSMPAAPDLGALARLLDPKGRLIVADINPVYTHLNPYYALIVHGQRLALRTNPVNPLGLSKEAHDVGLARLELEGIGTKDQSYSFVEVFERVP